MAVQAANVIDLQTYRQARAQRNKPVQDMPKAAFAMHPVIVWVPYWGFVPMLVMGNTRHGA